MKHLNEELLHAWLKLSTSIINNRVVSDLSYNESLVCNLLYHTYLTSPDSLLTATDLCTETNMLKSQMNRTLNSLEKKNIITRTRSSNDKRQVLVQFNLDSADTYLKQHQEILSLLDTIIDRLGIEKTQETIQLFHSICAIADTAISNMERK